MKRYLSPRQLPVAVLRYADNTYRAATLDYKLFPYIELLEYRDTVKDAQRDLDDLAVNLNLKEEADVRRTL